MGHRKKPSKPDNMMLLIVLPSLLSAVTAEAFFGGLAYGPYGGAALGYPFAYAAGNRVINAALPSPLLRSVAPVPVVPSVRTIPAAVPSVRALTKAAPVVEVKAAVAPSVKAVASSPLYVSTQYHAQDEAGNYKFGYDNINSARVEAGNSKTVVTGSYTNKDQGTSFNYISDSLGFRQL